VTTDKPSPQAAGTTIVVSATATCAGTPEFRFWIRPPGGAWRIVQDYSTSATWSWNTAGNARGTYLLEVDVRDHGSASSYDSVANLSFALS
jgi:hypothetical protein